MFIRVRQTENILSFPVSPLLGDPHFPSTCAKSWVSIKYLINDLAKLEQERFPLVNDFPNGGFLSTFLSGAVSNP